MLWAGSRAFGINRHAQVGFLVQALSAPWWPRALVEALRGSLPREAAGLRQVPGRRPLQEALGAAERLAENLRRDHEMGWGFMSTFTKTVRVCGSLRARGVLGHEGCSRA